MAERNGNQEDDGESKGPPEAAALLGFGCALFVAGALMVAELLGWVKKAGFDWFFPALFLGGSAYCFYRFFARR